MFEHSTAHMNYKFIILMYTTYTFAYGSCKHYMKLQPTMCTNSGNILILFKGYNWDQINSNVCGLDWICKTLFWLLSLQMAGNSEMNSTEPNVDVAVAVVYADAVWTIECDQSTTVKFCGAKNGVKAKQPQQKWQPQQSKFWSTMTWRTPNYCNRHCNYRLYTFPPIYWFIII